MPSKKTSVTPIHKPKSLPVWQTGDSVLEVHFEKNDDASDDYDLHLYDTDSGEDIILAADAEGLDEIIGILQEARKAYPASTAKDEDGEDEEEEDEEDAS